MSDQDSLRGVVTITDGLRDALASSAVPFEVQHLDVTRFSSASHDRALAKWLAERWQPGRWGVEARVQADAVIEFREPSLWSRYRWAIVGMLALVLVQGGVISALLVERRFRRRLQRSLDSALHFERTLGQVSRILAEDELDLDRAIEDSLRRVARELAVERAFVWELTSEGARMRPSFVWVDAGQPPPPAEAALDQFPRLAQALRDGQVLQLDRNAEDREALEYVRSFGVYAIMAAPLRAAGVTVGALVVSSRTQEPVWTAEHRQRLAAFAEVLANVLVHRRSQRQLRESEAFNDAVLASHAGEVAVADAAGVIVAANEAWTRAACRDGGPLAGHPTGTVFGEGAMEDAHAAQARSLARAALRGVLNSASHDASVELEWRSPEGHAWSEMRVRRLDRPEGGAVLSHVDITARKRAELHVQQHLHELAHLNMVSAIGELAASVAHELNQPLTAVLSNAQALRRLIAPGQKEEHGELIAEIVDDIISQDKRAGDVLQRIRRLLKKETIERAPLDVNAVVADITRMFASDAAMAAVPIVLELAVGLPPVRGDRVQLQQVVLNLVQNAVQAVRSSSRPSVGAVRVRTSLEPDGVRILVVDAGPGIASDLLGRVFEPFFTTRGEGLGLGLSISRSIVELHGGRIAARNLPEGGAEFSVTLPLEVVAA